MTCTNSSCKAEFCFVCLSKWRRAHTSPTTCRTAPAQTTLSDPTWDQRSDDDANQAQKNSRCVIL